MTRLGAFVLAIVLASHALPAAAPNEKETLSVSVCESPVRVFLAIYTKVGAAPRRMDWIACGRDATKLPAPEAGRLAPDPPRGSFVVANGAIDIDIEVPAAPRAVHFRGRKIPVGARAAALQGGPGARVWVEPVTRRLLTVKGNEVAPAVLAREIARVSAARVDGIERLGTEVLNVSFSGVHVADVLQVAAYVSEVLLLREGDTHFAYSTPQVQRKLTDLEAAVESARSRENPVALEAALQRFLAFVKPPPKGPVIAASDHWLEAAQLAEIRGDHVAAERLLREGLAHIERIQGGAIGADYGTTLGELASLRSLKKQNVDAMKLLEQGLAIAERELGPVDPRLATMLEKLAFERVEQKRLAEAEALFKRAIESHEASSASDALALHYVVGGLASLYLEQERFEEAEPILERELALARDGFGEVSVVTAQARVRLALGLLQLDSLQRAAQLLELAIAARGPGPASQEMQRKVDAIRALGPYAGDKPPGAGALVALRATLARGVPDGTRYEMSSMLERRAKRQYREAPAGKAWRVSCEAQAEVMTTSAAPGSARAYAIERCLRSASSAERP